MITWLVRTIARKITILHRKEGKSVIAETIGMLIRKNSLEEKIQLLAQANGRDYILNKLAEECAEYTAAHLKIHNDGADMIKLADRASELADICVLIRQFEEIGTEEEKTVIRNEMEMKVDRALTRMAIGKGA